MSDEEYEVTCPDGQKTTITDLYIKKKEVVEKPTTDLEDHYKDPVDIKTSV
jgi:hypothetical protein